MNKDGFVDTRNSAPIAFLLQTLVAQCIAAAIAVIMWPVLNSVPLVLAAASGSAALTSVLLRLSVPWIAINASLPLACFASLSLEIPSEFFFIAFAILASIYVPAFWTRVPYYPTQRAAYPLILAELPTDRPFTFIDVGCGFGDLLCFLQRQRPNGLFIGIEVGPLPFLISQARAIFRPHMKIRFQSMWACSFSDFDTVYAFLSPAPMERLWTKASIEMREGTTFISNSFPAPAKASETIPLRDERRGSLYIYRMPGTMATNNRASH